MSTPVLMYGILANVLTMVPWVLYVMQTDTDKYAQYHRTYVQMLTACYGPMAFAFWLVLLFDS